MGAVDSCRSMYLLIVTWGLAILTVLTVYDRHNAVVHDRTQDGAYSESYLRSKQHGEGTEAAISRATLSSSPACMGQG